MISEQARRLCIIPARGGSKRIPRKNIRAFLGKPIIAYPILAALASELFETVMVSTDDQEIAEIARSLGADVPFLRSEKTSDDFASTADVLQEVLGEYKKAGQHFEYACCCYPAAPFITKDKLSAAYTLLTENDVDAVIPVCEYQTPILRALALEGQNLRFMWPENQFKRSQDLAPAYFDIGLFYFFRTECFWETKSLFPPKTLGLTVPPEECQDIDHESDWKLAELKYQLWQESQRE